MNFEEFVDEIGYGHNRRWDCPTPVEALEWAKREAVTLGKWVRRWDDSRPLPPWLISHEGVVDQRGRPYVDVLVVYPRNVQELPRSLGGLPVVARVQRQPNPRCQQTGLGELSGECAPLPSGNAMADLVAGDPDALGRVLMHTFLRTSLIGAGMLAVGARKGTVIRDAIAGSLGIDAFVLAWSLWNKNRT